MIANDEYLVAYLRERPPRAILSGFEERSLEQPLVAYARSHQYKPVTLIGNKVAWVKQ